MTMKRTVDVRLLATVPWGPQFPEEVSVVGPGTGDAAFVVPGPLRIPTRPRLELATGYGGVAARILGPDGLPRPWAIRVVGEETQLVELPSGPLSVAPSVDGGLWFLEPAGLGHVASDGEVARVVDLTGVRVVSAAKDAVWILDLTRCWLVRANGEILGPHAWRDPLAAVVSSDRLCRLDLSEPLRLRCMDAGGNETSTPVSTLEGAFERLVHVDGHLVTSTVNTLIRYEHDGLVSSLTLTGAGLTSSGEPFLSSTEGDHVALWTSGASGRRLPLSPAGLTTGTVVAVDGQRALVWAGSRAAWYDGPQLERSFEVIEQSYADEVFPHAWRADNPFPFVAEADEQFLIASSGPSGAAILSFRWS